MGSAADALVGAAQPAGAGRWDIENKLGVEVPFGQDGASMAPLTTEAPLVWLDLLLPQVNTCFCTQSQKLDFEDKFGDCCNGAFAGKF